MTNFPWFGKAAPMSNDAFIDAAQKLNCEVASILAVYQAESSGRPYRKDGSVERRYEPHKMPGSKLNWRDSFKIKFGRREAMFAAAYASQPEAALRATSWHGPQIMGFNCKAAGYDTALAMVEDMADREVAGLEAFVSFVISTGLATHLRAKDFYSLAKGYNGTGQAKNYESIIWGHYRRLAAKNAVKNYQKITGHRPPVVLRIGSRGADVVILQRALLKRGYKIGKADGSFGRNTDTGVRAFQTSQNLFPDGVVGAMTWDKLLPQQSVPKV